MKHSPLSWSAALCLPVALILTGVALNSGIDRLSNWAAPVGKDLARAAKNVASASGNINKISAALADDNRGISPILAALTGKHGIKQVLENVDGVTAQIGRTSVVAHNASLDEQAALVGGKDSHGVVQRGLMVDLSALVTDTDSSINGDKGTLPALTADLEELKQVEASLTATDGPIQSSGAMMREGTKLIGDPNIQRAIQGLADATEQGKEAAAHASGAAANAERGLGYVADSLKPKHLSFWQQAESMALGPILGGVVQLFLHWHPQDVVVTNQPK